MKRTIEIERLSDPVIIDEKAYYLVTSDELGKLVAENAEKGQDIETLRKIISSILDILGLLDRQTGSIKECVASGEEGWMKHVLKGLNKVILDVGMASLSKAKAAELKKRFSFIPQLIPIIKKYGIRK